MLHLAQVQKNERSGELELRLLVRQKTEDAWAIMTHPEVIAVTDANSFHERLLVLIELDDSKQILTIQEATGWVLNLVQQYLSTGITPTFLQQEAERAEQWRQDLTLQSQDLARRNLEMEARQEQIQVLEQNLKRQKEELEALSSQLKTKQEQIQTLEEDLERRREEVESRGAALKTKIDLNS